jgi:hypothetical protein
MDRKIEWYPQENFYPYYVEFSQWEGQPECWTLFQRNFFCSEPEWQKILVTVEEDLRPLMARECHPWNLGGGIVNQNDVICMETRKFLKFMVDSMNLYHQFKKEALEKDGSRQNKK